MKANSKAHWTSHALFGALSLMVMLLATGCLTSSTAINQDYANRITLQKEAAIDQIQGIINPRSPNKHNVVMVDTNGITLGLFETVYGPVGNTGISDYHVVITHTNTIAFSEITKIALQTGVEFESSPNILFYTKNGYAGYQTCDLQRRDQLLSAYLSLCPNIK